MLGYSADSSAVSIGNHIPAGNTSITQPANRVFYPALDGLRAVAFTLVFLVHYLRFPWGWCGVNVFFVLSGFLITGILLDTQDDLHRVRNFYVRRTLRIFPLYYGLAIAALLLWSVLHWQWSAWWLAWPLYLGNFLRFIDLSVTTQFSPLWGAANGWLAIGKYPDFGFNVGHFWSLCVEEQFYLLWPWVVFFVRSRKALLWICGATVLLVPIARAILQHTAAPWMLDQELLYRLTPLQFDSLLLGAMLALFWRGAHREVLMQIAQFIAPLMIGAWIAYTLITLPSFGLQGFFDYHYPSWKFSLGLSYINLLSAALILCCLRGGGFFYKLLSDPALRWLGRISYGAYVFHDIFHSLFMHLVREITDHYPMPAGFQLLLVAAFAFPTTLLVAWLSYRFFENRFLGLKERLTVRG